MTSSRPFAARKAAQKRALLPAAVPQKLLRTSLRPPRHPRHAMNQGARSSNPKRSPAAKSSRGRPAMRVVHVVANDPKKRQPAPRVPQRRLPRSLKKYPAMALRRAMRALRNPIRATRAAKAIDAVTTSVKTATPADKMMGEITAAIHGKISAIKMTTAAGAAAVATATGTVTGTAIAISAAAGTRAKDRKSDG